MRFRVSPLASFVAGVLAASWILLAAPSQAHPPGNFFNKRWVANKNVPYAFTPTVPAGAWRSQINAAAQTWNAVGEPMKFNNVASVANYEPRTCPSAYQRNGVHLRAIDGVGGTLGRAYLCWKSTGELYSFQLVFDQNDRWSVDDSPSSNESDLQSVAAHELGHGAGFAGHFAKASGICGNVPSQHTMCSGHRPGTTRQRTLELHDKHTFQSAY